VADVKAMTKTGQKLVEEAEKAYANINIAPPAD